MGRIEQFQGRPILVLTEQSEGRPFSIGIGKAKIILKQLESIKKFVAENDNPNYASTVSKYKANKKQEDAMQFANFISQAVAQAVSQAINTKK